MKSSYKGLVERACEKCYILTQGHHDFPPCYLYGSSEQSLWVHLPCQQVHLFLVCAFFGYLCKREKDTLKGKANKQWRPETTLWSVGNGIQRWVTSPFPSLLLHLVIGESRCNWKALMLLCVPFRSCSCLWEVDAVLLGCTSALSIPAPLRLASPLDLPCPATCGCTRTTVLKPLTFPYPYLSSQFSKIQHPQVSPPPNSASSSSQTRSNETLFCFWSVGVKPGRFTKNQRRWFQVLRNICNFSAPGFLGQASLGCTNCSCVLYVVDWIRITGIRVCFFSWK